MEKEKYVDVSFNLKESVMEHIQEASEALEWSLNEVLENCIEEVLDCYLIEKDKEVSFSVN